MNDDLISEQRLALKPPTGLPARWLDAIAPEIYRTWRERSVARQTSRASRRLYLEVESTRPELTGVTRYREVIARQTGLDDAQVRRIIARAETSFANWPVERPLKFRDVVQYLVVYQCLEADPRALGTRSRLTTIIAEEIPNEF